MYIFLLYIGQFHKSVCSAVLVQCRPTIVKQIDYDDDDDDIIIR